MSSISLKPSRHNLRAWMRRSQTKYWSKSRLSEQGFKSHGGPHWPQMGVPQSTASRIKQSAVNSNALVQLAFRLCLLNVERPPNSSNRLGTAAEGERRRKSGGRRVPEEERRRKSGGGIAEEEERTKSGGGRAEGEFGGRERRERAEGGAEERRR